MLKILTLFLVAYATCQVSSGAKLDLSNAGENVIDIRKVHPTFSYFDYLPVFGLWGKVGQFILEDTRAFGLHYAYMDTQMKLFLGYETYKLVLDTSLTDYTLMFKILQKLPMFLSRVSDIRSPRTGKTFGQAIRTLLGFMIDTNASNKLINRLNKYESKQTPKDDVHLKQDVVPSKQLLDDPEKIATILADPKVYQAVSKSLIASLNDINFKEGLQSAKQVTQLLHSLFPEAFEKIVSQLSKVKDPESGNTLGDAAKIIYNIFTDPKTGKQLLEIVKENKTVPGLTAEKGKVILQEILKQVSSFVNSVGKNMTRHLAASPGIHDRVTSQATNVQPMNDFAQNQIREAFKSGTKAIMDQVDPKERKQESGDINRRLQGNEISDMANAVMENLDLERRQSRKKRRHRPSRHDQSQNNAFISSATSI